MIADDAHLELSLDRNLVLCVLILLLSQRQWLGGRPLSIGQLLPLWIRRTQFVAVAD